MKGHRSRFQNNQLLDVVASAEDYDGLKLIKCKALFPVPSN